MVDKKKVLVTGAGGFVGRHVLSFLSKNPSIEVVASVESGQGEGVGLRIARMNITDADEVRRTLKEERPSHVLHLAAVSAKYHADQDPRKAWQINVEGTQNIALSLVESLPDCRLVFCSSSEVYGNSFLCGRSLDETALLQPTSVYAATKAAADLMVGQMACNGLRAVRIRPFNHFGPGQRPDFVVPAFAKQIADIEHGLSEPVIRVGNLHVNRDFLDVRDVAAAYSAVIEDFDRLPNGSILNIASGQAVSIESILNKLLSFSTKTVSVSVDPERFRSNDVPLVAGDATKFRDFFGWHPRYTLDETLMATLNYFRHH